MGQNTSRLGLYLPGGGSTGLITPDEPADIDKINDNMTKLDADAGAYVCTSSTRPATPYNGKIIFETDTRKTMIYKSATTSWEPVDSQGKIVANAAARDALFASPVQGTKVFRTDTGVTETYYAAWNASTNPGGKTPAGWYIAERSMGLVPIVPPTVAVSGGSATANSLGEVSFTTASSIALNNIFTNAYRNYKIFLTISQSSLNTQIWSQLRIGTANQTGANWSWGGVTGNNTGTIGGTSGSGITYAAFGYAYSASQLMFTAEITLYNPNISTHTAYTTSASTHTGSNILYIAQGGKYEVATAVDGIIFYPGSGGTISGTIQVFGMNT